MQCNATAEMEKVYLLVLFLKKCSEKVNSFNVHAMPLFFPLPLPFRFPVFFEPSFPSQSACPFSFLFSMFWIASKNTSCLLSLQYTERKLFLLHYLSDSSGSDEVAESGVSFEIPASWPRNILECRPRYPSVLLAHTVIESPNSVHFIFLGNRRWQSSRLIICVYC